MEKYIFSKEIGSGSFGKVYLIESKQTGIQYVLKQIDLNKLDKKQVKSASKEVEVLSQLKHSNIVRYKESYEINNRLNIIMEYCENGDLHKKIKEKRLTNECFKDNEILDYFVQICLALEYIHKQKILHRDLKTKNIFLTKGNLIKLGDFGVAKVLENSFELASTCIGSPYYISPEICENKPYNKKSDIWALGCVLYELSTLKYAFVAKNVKILISKITSGSFNPLPTNVNAQIRSLLINLLKPNPKDRPTASEILNKPYMLKFKFKYSSENYCDVMRKRSYSGEYNRKCVTLNNEVKILSNSCNKLNDLNKKNKLYVTAPESKYKVPIVNNRLKCLKKTYSLNFDRKNSAGMSVQTDRFNSSDTGHGKEDLSFSKEQSEEKRNWEMIKFVKLLKVDSEYYNLIAESNRMRTGTTNDKIHAKTENGINGYPKEEQDIASGEGGYEKKLLSDQCDKMKEGIPAEVQEPNESRKRWTANTCDKNQLLTILSEAELIDITSLKAQEMTASDKERPNLTVDDLLKLDPSEMSENVLKPIKIEDNMPVNGRVSDNYLSLLKEEIKEIKEKFEANDRNYDVQDLLKLTENSRKILREEISRKYSGDENSAKNESDSIYFDLELKRMQLEKTVGLNVFLMAYRKMIDILNGNVHTDLKEESIVSGTDTYVIQKEQYSGDNKKPIENTWLMIIEAFETKKEFIPDVWECAVRESVYY